MLVGSFRRSSKYCIQQIRCNSTADLQYCINLVKEHDYENYLVGSLLPQKYREVYFAVRAYHVEISVLRENVKGNTLTGRMRMQWWKSSIDDLYNKDTIPTDPVQRALQPCIKKYNLTKRYFERVIDSRYYDLNMIQPDTLSDVENLAEQAHSSILYLLLEAMQLQDEKTMILASHVGVGSGITTFLRGTPQHITQGYMCLPADVIAKEGISQVTPEQIRNKRIDMSKLKSTIYEVACQAYGHLDKARSMQNEAKRAAMPLMMTAIPAQQYLTDLQEADFDVFNLDSVIRKTPLSLQWQLLKASYSGKI